MIGTVNSHPGGSFRIVFDPPGEELCRTILSLNPAQPQMEKVCINCLRDATYVNKEGHSLCSHYCDLR